MTGAESLLTLLYKEPQSCHSIGSISFLKLIVSAQNGCIVNYAVGAGSTGL